MVNKKWQMPLDFDHDTLAANVVTTNFLTYPNWILNNRDTRRRVFPLLDKIQSLKVREN